MEKWKQTYVEPKLSLELVSSSSGSGCFLWGCIYKNHKCHII